MQVAKAVIAVIRPTRATDPTGEGEMVTAMVMATVIGITGGAMGATGTVAAAMVAMGAAVAVAAAAVVAAAGDQGAITTTMWAPPNPAPN